MIRSVCVISAVGLLSAFAVGCGSSGDGSASSTNSVPAVNPAVTPSPSASAAMTLQTATNSQGTYLTDGAGRSLYLFASDVVNAGTSTCYTACATAWPPLVVASGQTPTASGSVQQSLISTFQRTDGTTEITYAGMPLYYYAGDALPGQTNGQGMDQFGAIWYLVQPDGTALRR